MVWNVLASLTGTPLQWPSAFGKPVLLEGLSRAAVLQPVLTALRSSSKGLLPLCFGENHSNLMKLPFFILGNVARERTRCHVCLC